MTSHKLDEEGWSQSPTVQIMEGTNKSYYEIRWPLEVRTMTDFPKFGKYHLNKGQLFAQNRFDALESPIQA